MTELGQALPAREQVGEDVNRLLDHFFADEITKAEAIGPAYTELWEAFSKLVLAGGKRLRPYLMVLAYQACGGRNYEGAVRVGAGHELLHAGLLAHDDIIDRDFIRYGRPNVSGVFRDKYRLVSDESAATHYAHGAAMLAGDLAISAATQFLFSAPFPDAQKQAAMRWWSAGIFEVAGGELLDAEASLYGPEHPDSLSIARYKTAGYSFISPLCVGAALAGASDKTIGVLQRVGESLGVAYQLTDDMLGLFGDEKATGKSSLSDLQEGKPTYIMQRALQLADAADREFILGVLGDATASYDELKKVQAIIERCGAKSEAQAKIAEYETEALKGIGDLALPGPAAEAFRHFISLALRREA